MLFLKGYRKHIFMNKEFNDNNYQDAPHNEGQQNNIAQHRTDGTNNPPELERSGTQNQQSSQSGQDGTRTESNRQNKNEDEGIRGGNSSI